MAREYIPYIPQTIDELWDQLGSMMLGSPKFQDKSGYFPGMSIQSEFFALNEGLKNLRDQLGEDRYQALLALSDRMRAHFEADPEDKTEDAIKGRELILQMEDILRS
ncbi:MAG TPA: hypothetical protein VFR36_00230 [Sphingomicrobium sp.]|nr:hypothetical protein [Sphingomicrobium sp.]